ncbi:MAG: flagellar hook protein FlgE [Acidimicrobiales bacterium]
MIRSMFSAISGLRSHRTLLDVVGNNIANVNTAGFKSSGVVFQDVLSQTVQGAGAGAPTADIGGTNASQVGLGVSIGRISTSFSQGALQRTSRDMDFALRGDGFFSVKAAGEDLYTRAGSLSLDAFGRLVTPTGGLVQGWAGDAAGVIDTNLPIGDITIPVGDLIAPQATSEVILNGNLPTGDAVGATYTTSVEVFDTQGQPTLVSFTFTKTAADQWTVSGTYGDPGSAFTLTDNGVTFDANGDVTAPADFDVNIASGQVPGVPAFTLELNSSGGRLSQYGELATVSISSQNGSAAGSLQSLTVSQEGVQIGSYSNGRNKSIAQFAVAVFNNPEGLEKVGDSGFRTTVNSGVAQMNVAGLGGRGLISSGTLEMSNVDLATEFTNLIVAQRGFQANSRVVTASDEVLADIVNLKR